MELVERNEDKTSCITLWVLMRDDDVIATRRKREGKMKKEIRPNYTDYEYEEDQANGDEQVVVDMESLIAAAIEIDQNPPLPRKLHKVPARMREKFPSENFDPQVVAIGLYHHHQPQLKPLQRIKIAALRAYVDLLLAAEGGGRVDKYNNGRRAEVMKHLWAAVANEVLDEEQQPKYYRKKAMSKHGVADEKALVCMMLLDGCFLLHFIEAANAGKTYPSISDHMVPLVVHDMFLLENQIPFPVLLALYKTMAIYRGGSEVIFRRQILEFIHTRILFPCFYNLTGRSSSQGPSLNNDNMLPIPVSNNEEWSRVAHLLYVLRHFVLGKPKAACGGATRARRRKCEVPPLHTSGSVMELKDAGIKFSNSSAWHLTEITFKKNAFFPEILVPPIVITRDTISYFLNMIAWEMQLDNPTDRSITSYVSFLNSVINHAEDVKELRLRGVLYHGLGSDEEVAELFNHWPIDAMRELPVYRDVSGYIYNHRQKPWRLDIAEFVYTHFRSPWTVLSLAAAIILLILTLLQTIFSIKH